MKKQTESILLKRYAHPRESTWEEICARVSTHIGNGNVKDIGNFYQVMADFYFVPGGRILANSGSGIKNLANCFTLPLEDSRRGIYKTLGDAADIFAWGGGVGYNFSTLREKGALIHSTGGKSSGVVEFMELFNSTGDIIQQASRRAAQMAILNVNHPDIVEFITHKSSLNTKNHSLYNKVEQETIAEHKAVKELGYKVDTSQEKTVLGKLKSAMLEYQLNYFNISVGITNDFMEAVKNDAEWNLISPDTGEIKKTLPAKELFTLLAKTAWATGDPGVVFLDRVNEDNMTPEYGYLETSNPCSEIFLYPYESCVLGSVNLKKMFDANLKEEIDYELLEHVVRTGVRFLDKVHDISYNNVPEINEVSQKFRRIGLGVMGWADLLVLMDIPYSSDKAKELAKQLSRVINLFAWSESMRLAEEKGMFPYAEENLPLLDFTMIDKMAKDDLLGGEILRSGQYRVRNVAVTAIAPTGGLSLIAEVNSAIEPFFALGYNQHLTDGDADNVKETIFHINPLLKQKMKDRGFEQDVQAKIMEAVEKTGSIQAVKGIPQEFKELFRTSHEILPSIHIDMQSAWQTYFSNAISKTINLSEDATVEDVESAFTEMWEKGCKGGTIYRDKSKSFQIMNNV